MVTYTSPKLVTYNLISVNLKWFQDLISILQTIQTYVVHPVLKERFNSESSDGPNNMLHKWRFCDRMV